MQLALVGLGLDVFGQLARLRGVAVLTVGGAGKDQNRLRGEKGGEVVFVHKFNLRMHQRNQSAPMSTLTWAVALRASGLKT